jgi:alpha-L-rhamnosidase
MAGSGPAYHYPQYQYYNAFDITPLVKPGAANQVAVFQHWFGGGQGRPANARGVILKAVIHYADGSHVDVNTDATWRQAEAAAWVSGQRRRNGEGVGYIERIDARRLEAGWHLPGYDDSDWGLATVVGAHPTAPWTRELAPDLTRIVETEFAPASITRLGEGTFVMDLGKVYAGVPRIAFSGGEAGAEVAMLGGYRLDAAGAVDPAYNQNTDLRFSALLNGGHFVFRPAEYFGMRYVQIEGSPMPITEANFSFIARHSAMDGGRSSFASSDAVLNAVWALMKHSIPVCAQEAFVDTPTREKGGFLGDAAIQSMVAMPVYGERLLTRRSLGEFLQSMDQHWSGEGDRGRINAVYPNADGARDIPDYTQAFLPWVWAYYMETGDRPFLAANYGRFKDVADYVLRHRDEVTGLIRELTGGGGAYLHGIVDWPADMRYGYDMTAARTVINAWAYADFDVLARIADTLGYPADRDVYRGHAEALREAMQARLLNAGGVYVDGLGADGEPSTHVSQHANMFPLALGIVPEGARASVIAAVKERRMSVGMVTVWWLVRALGEADEGEHLLELFTNPAWHGWARSLERGATATWESWTADETGQSLSHGWGAAGLEGYVRYILGVAPLAPQYERVQIRPLAFGDRLSHARGRVPTDRGEIAVAWEREADRYRLRVILPVNVRARVYLPRGEGADVTVWMDGAPVEAVAEGRYLAVADVGSGTHEFVRRDPAPSGEQE